MIEIMTADHLRSKLAAIERYQKKEMEDRLLASLNHTKMDELLTKIQDKLQEVMPGINSITLSIRVDEVGYKEVDYVKSYLIKSGYIITENEITSRDNTIRWFIGWNNKEDE